MSTPDADARRRATLYDPDHPDRPELWAKLAYGLAAVDAALWAAVLLSIEDIGVFAYAVLPMLLYLALPLTLWGVWHAMTHPPLLRPSRVVALVLLLLISYVNTAPLFPAPVSTADWTSHHPYRLPFDGPWATLAGGDGLDTNVYARTPQTRFAYAFAAVDSNTGSLHGATPTSLEDFPCFGAPVLAPAPGRVTKVVADQPDLAPDTDLFEMDGRNSLGNHVVLRVDRDEFLVLAHLKEDSITVEQGQEVQTGQRLGQCGNSGLSQQPHLLVLLQSGPDYPYHESLPLRFDRYRVRGEQTLIDRGVPLGDAAEDRFGQIVEHAGE